MTKPKIIRVTTVPTSLNTFCYGFLAELSSDYEVIALSSSGWELDEIANRERVHCIAVDMERRISPFKDLVSLARLVKVFLKEKPTMVHSMTPKAGLLTMIAAWIARVPLRVHTFTGLVFPTATGLNRRVLILTDTITCACATHIIPEGEGVKNDLISHNITRKPLKVLGYGNVRGVDMQYYSRTADVIKEAAEIRCRLGIAPGDTVFVFVGRLVGDKGIKELAEAFVRLYDEHKNIHLLLVGREEEHLDSLDVVTKRIVDDCEGIHKVGEQSDVRPWYAAADALVFPSYREGFPNVVLEAGAMELASIVTDINGSREIIEEGSNGTIVPVRNSDSLYCAMRRFITEPHIMRQMSANARNIISQRYEMSFVRRCLKDFYKSLFKNN